VPLGDSITEITCWRALVWDMLVAANVADQVDFVGSRATNQGQCGSQSSSSTFDLDHEGHSGWQAVNIANAWIDAWMEVQKPDITMFMLGSNDVTAGRATAQIIAAYDTILGAMRAANPRMKVIVRTFFLRLIVAALTGGRDRSTPSFPIRLT
jgi:lysophospholipase L1-like esterase